MAEGPATICPKCGQTPLPAAAEECPSCGEVFSYMPLHRRAIRAGGRGRYLETHDLEATETTAGGIRSSVTAHPEGLSFLLGLGALFWVLKAAGPFSPEPLPWAFGLVGLLLVCAMALMRNVGPAKGLAELSPLVQLVAAVVAASTHWQSVQMVSLASYSASLWLMSLGEPSTARRRFGMVLGAMSLGGAAAALVLNV